MGVVQVVLEQVDPEKDPNGVELEKAVKAALKRDYDTATLHSLTLGHGGGDMPEESWASMLDFSMVDSS